MHKILHKNVIYNSKNCKQPKCPSIRHWLNKIQLTSTLMVYQAGTKRLKDLSLSTGKETFPGSARHKIV